MKNLDKLIEEHLIKHAQTTKTFDKYGQHPIHDMQISRFIPAVHVQEVNTWLESGNSKKFRLSCYGNRHFTFYAIQIKDPNVSKQFNTHLQNNPAHREAVNLYFNS